MYRGQVKRNSKARTSVLHLQYCTCPAGYEVSCPENGTAPGCVLLPISTKGLSTVSIVMTLLAVCLAAVTAWNHQLTADLCRLCLGAGNPLGKHRSDADQL